MEFGIPNSVGHHSLHVILLQVTVVGLGSINKIDIFLCIYGIEVVFNSSNENTSTMASMVLHI